MKKLLAIILALCMLSGCSLAALGTGGGLPVNDELMGFLLTVSIEDENGITDIWNEEAAGMEPIGNHQLEGEKLYATRIEEDGDVRYEFPEGCGLSCFSYYVFSDGEEEAYRTSIESPELKDVHRGVYVGDGKRTELEATIYGTKDSKTVVELNPVYQTPEGEVYVLGTAPLGYDVASMHGCSTTVSQEAKINMGGETVTGSTVKLNIERVVLPECYIILEMSESNAVLSETSYAPDEMPETYAPGADTAYIILEARDGADTTRTVYSPGDDTVAMDTYYPGQYGLCVKGYTRIEWEGAE